MGENGRYLPSHSQNKKCSGISKLLSTSYFESQRPSGQWRKRELIVAIPPIVVIATAAIVVIAATIVTTIIIIATVFATTVIVAMFITIGMARQAVTKVADAFLTVLTLYFLLVVTKETTCGTIAIIRMTGRALTVGIPMIDREGVVKRRAAKCPRAVAF